MAKREGDCGKVTQSGKQEGGASSGGGKEGDDEKGKRKFNVAKAESPVWKNLKPYQGKTRTNGLKGKQEKFYQWDGRHNDIEVYRDLDGKLKHEGSMDPITGKIYKGPVPGRIIEK